MKVMRLFFRHICRSGMVLFTTSLLLAPAVYAQQDNGYLHVTSQPGSAMIYVDSEFTGSKTPTSKLLSLKPGVYRLALTKPGYRIYEDRMTIESGKVLEVDVLLTSADSEELSRLIREQYVEAYLTVRSTPPGADVYLDDQHIGKTPVKDHKIQPGESIDRKLKITRAGYKPYEETIGWTTIRDGIKIQVFRDLNPAEQTIAKPEITPQSQKKRFIINTQVIAFSILLVAMITIFVVRLVIRIRQRVRNG